MEAGAPNPPPGPPPIGAFAEATAPARKRPMRIWVRILFGVVGIIAIISGLAEIFGGGHNANYGKDNIRYSGDATRADADALAKALTDEPYFGTNANGVTVLLDKKGDAITLGFAVKSELAADPATMKLYQGVAVDVAPSIPGQLTTIRLVDAELTEKQATNDVAGGGHNAKYAKDNIRYYHDATRPEADALAKALQAVPFFGTNPSGLTVLLDKTAGAITLSFVINPDKANDPEIIKGFHDIAVAVVKSVPGKLTTVKLIDAEMREKKSIDTSHD